MQNIKCVVVGDRASEKTTLLNTYTTKSFPVDYAPTVFNNCSTQVTVDGSSYSLCLWDTAGHEDYDRIRPLSYQDANVLLLCFAVDSPATYDNIKKKWLPEAQRHAAGIPFLLVGTKVDLRNNPKTIAKLEEKKQVPITKAQGEALCAELKGFKYMECSALTQEGVDAIFDEAIRCAVSPAKIEQKGKCTIM